MMGAGAVAKRMRLTAHDLKTRGVSAIERLLQDAQEVLISVQGKPRNDFLRECETAGMHTARVQDELTDAF